jgi:hypothetical protein
VRTIGNVTMDVAVAATVDRSPRIRPDCATQAATLALAVR